MFKNILKNLLDENDLTQTELAIKSGIPKTTINGWFNAGRKPDYLALQKLCEFFNVSADSLLGKENNTQKNNNIISTLTSEEKEIINNYNELTNAQKAEVKGFIKGLLSSNKINFK